MGGTDDPELEREWSAIHAAVELAAVAGAIPSDPLPSSDDTPTDMPLADEQQTRDDGVDAFDSTEHTDVRDVDVPAGEP